MKIIDNDLGGKDLVHDSMGMRYQCLPTWKKKVANNPLLTALSKIDRMYLSKIHGFSNVIRRFEERTDNDVIDSIKGNNATLKLPSSSFNGVDSSCEFANTTDNTGIDFSAMICINDNITSQVLFTEDLTSGQFLIRIQGGKIEILVAEVSIILSTPISLGYNKIKVTWDK